MTGSMLARILGLRALDDGVRRPLLAALVSDLARLSAGGPLVVLIWARADASDVQNELQSLGFFPSAYLPELISTIHAREDVVQYTLLVGRSLRESVDSVTAQLWPEAWTVIEQVLGFKTEA